MRRECGSSWLCVYSPSSSSFCCADPTLKRELLVFVGGKRNGARRSVISFANSSKTYSIASLSTFASHKLNVTSNEPAEPVSTNSFGRLGCARLNFGFSAVCFFNRFPLPGLRVNFEHRKPREPGAFQKRCRHLQCLKGSMAPAVWFLPQLCKLNQSHCLIFTVRCLEPKSSGPKCSL